MNESIRVMIPRLVAVLIGMLANWAGIEIGEGTGQLSPDAIETMAFGLGLLGYAVTHRFTSRAINPADVATPKVVSGDQVHATKVE